MTFLRETATAIAFMAESKFEGAVVEAGQFVVQQRDRGGGVPSENRGARKYESFWTGPQLSSGEELRW